MNNESGLMEHPMNFYGMIRPRIAEYAVILGIILLLASCSKESEKADVQPAPVEEYTVMPLEVQQPDSTKNDTLSPNKKAGKTPTTQSLPNSYDDGYLDGEAMAEEDRQAGKPGMQVGMDDDDDDEDYEEGFDDGYE